MIRTYTDVGKQDYTQVEIEQSINSIKWEEFRTSDLPYCQGKCLEIIIKECKIPLSKISRMELHGVIKNSHGFYALDVTYKNGHAKIYIADNGVSSCVVASDFEPNEKKERVTDGRTLSALSKKGFFTYPVDRGHKYIDEEKNPRQFIHEGIKYCIDYVDGCFFPFLFKMVKAY